MVTSFPIETATAPVVASVSCGQQDVAQSAGSASRGPPRLERWLGYSSKMAHSEGATPAPWVAIGTWTSSRTHVTPTIANPNYRIGVGQVRRQHGRLSRGRQRAGLRLPPSRHRQDCAGQRRDADVDKSFRNPQHLVVFTAQASVASRPISISGGPSKIRSGPLS